MAVDDAKIIDNDGEYFTIKFKDKRYYQVDTDGNVEYIQITGGEKTLTVQCINSKNTVLVEYSYIILRDNYSKVSPTIDGYECSTKKIEGTITENTTIQVMYYLICKDDTTLVFTGLDSSGNATTNDSEIVSYMIGDGSSTSGNGLKEKDIKSVIEIPEVYNGKDVIKIGTNAFKSSENIVKCNISDNVKTIVGGAF